MKRPIPASPGGVLDGQAPVPGARNLVSDAFMTGMSCSLGRCLAIVSHGVVSGVIEHEVDVSGAERIEEVQPAFRGPRTEPGEPLIADPRAKPFLPA
jgi:hypothetical protein